MSPQFDQLMTQALALSPEERVELAQRLWDSVDCLTDGRGNNNLPTSTPVHIAFGSAALSSIGFSCWPNYIHFRCWESMPCRWKLKSMFHPARFPRLCSSGFQKPQ
jgi:hypothetical protein